jgi:hypothetical protein
MKAMKHAPFALLAAIAVAIAVVLLWRSSTIERLTSQEVVQQSKMVGNKITSNFITLNSGQAVQSPNKRFMFAMQTDGNAVLYETVPKAFWSTGTNIPGSKLSVMADGNMIVYNPNNMVVWKSNTPVKGLKVPFTMEMGDNGDLRVKDKEGRMVFFRYAK